MEPICQTIPADGAFARGVIGFLDCEAQLLGAQGYGALASPHSSVSLILTSLLAIFIALFGIRMLLGDVPDLRDGVGAVVKIGFVLALATAWPAYQTLIYNVTLKAPAELAAEVGGAAALPGTSGDLVERLDAADHSFKTLAILGVGVAFQPQNAPESAQFAPTPFVGFDRFALGASRATFLASAIGSFAVLRLCAGILLALGPLFIAFLLFDGTRWMFEGWVRTLAALALGAVAATLVLAIELSLLEPWLADLVARRRSDYVIPDAPGQLLAMTLVFAVVLVAVMRILLRVSTIGAWPSWTRRLPAAIPATRVLPAGEARGGMVVLAASEPVSAPTRAFIASQALEMQLLRERTLDREAGVGPGRLAGVSARASPTYASDLGREGAMPGYRRTSRRVSASAGRRDRRA